MGARRIDNMSIYVCDKCGKMYFDKYVAEICCKDYFCEDCGAPTPKYHLVCEKCSKKRRYEKATKMTYDEYIEKYPDNMIVYGDEYYTELEDLLDDLKGQKPDDYIYGTDKERIEINADCVLSDLEDNADIEDFYIDDAGREELYNFIDQWNAKYGQDIYCLNEKVIILLSEEDKKDIL